MTPPDIQTQLHDALPGATFELTALGLYCQRERLPDKDALRFAERVLLRHGPVRVLDLTHGTDLLSDNAVPHDGADIALYEGVMTSDGSTVFRVDHHYDVPSLARTSSTPMVLQWLRGLHERGRTDILNEVARSRYLADHADTDILLANHLAGLASDRSLLFGPLGDWYAAAALRNDYVLFPSASAEPQASRAFYTCIGLEKAVLASEVTFAETQSRYLPTLGRLLLGEHHDLDAQTVRRLDTWAEQMRAKEAQTLATISAWHSAGHLTWELGGRLAVLEAAYKIDNADFFLHLAQGSAKPVVQLLSYPAPNPNDGGVIYKVRAHDGFDLNPLLRHLQQVAPEARFGGRSAAGGSKPVKPLARQLLVDAVRWALDNP